MYKVYNEVVIRMLTDNKLLRIKNGGLLLLAVFCPIFCKLFSIPLPSVMSEWDKTSLYIRNMTGYLRDNYVSIIFFFANYHVLMIRKFCCGILTPKIIFTANSIYLLNYFAGLLGIPLKGVFHHSSSKSVFFILLYQYVKEPNVSKK